MTAPKPPSTKWAFGRPPRAMEDPLDLELEKLNRSKSNLIQAKEGGQLRAQRIPEEIKVRLQEKFPQNKTAQIGWVLRQLESLKEVFLDAADTPKNLHIAPLVQYRGTLVTIRDTVFIRDGNPRGRRATGKNPLRDLISKTQEVEIEKARKKGQANGTVESDD